MIVSTADARAVIVEALDGYIDDRIQALEMQIRADLATTSADDDSALDAPPDPTAPWRPISLEEVLCMERMRLESWRDALLETFDRRP